MSGEWKKKNIKDKIWWWYDNDQLGILKFSFDKKNSFNYWSDYPEKLTAEQKKIFDEENIFWANFRRKNNGYGR